MRQITPSEINLSKRLSVLGISHEMHPKLQGYEYDLGLPDYMVIIEVDGISHQTAKQQKIDLVKEKIARRWGFTLIRVKNEMVSEFRKSELPRPRHWNSKKYFAMTAAAGRDVITSNGKLVLRLPDWVRPKLREMAYEAGMDLWSYAEALLTEKAAEAGAKPIGQAEIVVDWEWPKADLA